MCNACIDDVRRLPRSHLSPAIYRGAGRWFLTICVADRRPVFVDSLLVSAVRDQFLLAARSWECAIVAYCFMPDHVHLLVEGLSEDADIARLVSVAKQRTGYAYGRLVSHRLWQPGWFDRVLRPSDDGREVLRYLLANPVRAGLVSDPSSYPFSGSGTVTREALFDSVY
jgi:putative transposase